MAIRYILLAALVGSAFSAHAGPEPSIYASTGTGTVLLATSATGQVQTYMPRAVDGFFVFMAPTAPATAPVMLPESGQFTAPPPASSGLIRPTPDFVQAPAPASVAAPEAQAPAPAEAQVTAPPEVTLADLVTVGIPADVLADVPPADTGAGADLAVGTLVDAVAPTVLLPDAVEINAVPEPGTGGLMLAGLAGVGFMARRRRSR